MTIVLNDIDESRILTHVSMGQAGLQIAQKPNQTPKYLLKIPIRGVPMLRYDKLTTARKDKKTLCKGLERTDITIIEVKPGVIHLPTLTEDTDPSAYT